MWEKYVIRLQNVNLINSFLIGSAPINVCILDIFAPPDIKT